MNIEEFETIFRNSEMRAWLAWDILEKSGANMREIYTRSPEALARLYTVWYAAPGGTNGDWRNSSDSPLRVGQATDTVGTWPAERVTRVAHFRAQFEKSRYPVQLTLPAYSPNTRDVLLLDGTHRAVAAHLSKKEVRLIVLAVQGPCDPRILPDLAHYSG
jgi:hypothetical protein